MRAVWNGAIQFGLVTIPIGLFKAIDDGEKVSFNQIDVESGSRIRQKKVRESDGAEVSTDTIVKGYPVAKDQYVIFTPEELESIAAEKSKLIEVIGFIPQDQPIDAVYLNTTYDIMPLPNSTGPTQLFMDAMSSCDVYALGSITMRSRQHLCIIQLTARGLELHTLHWPETVRPAPEWSGTYADAHLPMAEQLIEASTVDTLADTGFFEMSDPYADEVKALVEAKQAGQTIEAIAVVEPGTVDDLMKTLEASIKAKREQQS